MTCLNIDCLSVSWMTSFEMFFGWYLSRMFFYVETPSLFHSDASSDCCYQRLYQVYLEFRPNKILRSTAENFSSSRIHKHLQANDLHLKLANLSTLFLLNIHRYCCRCTILWTIIIIKFIQSPLLRENFIYNHHEHHIAVMYAPKVINLWL